MMSKKRRALGNQRDFNVCDIKTKKKRNQNSEHVDPANDNDANRRPETTRINNIICPPNRTS